MTAENTKMEELLNTFSLQSLLISPTCFKSVTPTSIDLILTNHKGVFYEIADTVTGTSDLHALTLTS